MLDLAAQDPYQPPGEIQVLQRAEVFWEQDLGDRLTKAPPELFVAGDVALLQAPLRVSIVGARKASEDGLRRAGKLAAQLATRGIVVVSGLAEGVDAAAHRGAISAGGRTIAVIGTPLNRCYPAKHAALQSAIHREHLLVSQFAMAAKVGPANFIARNRTMAMLSHTSVIVEASDSSGSLSQAAEVQRLGRPLFIMRSLLDNKRLTWPAAFLKAGAQILDDVVQILDARTPPRNRRLQQLSLCEGTGDEARAASEAV